MLLKCFPLGLLRSRAVHSGYPCELKVTLPQDQTTTVEFLVDKVGEFRWKCGRPCGNSCPKMNGKLIVTEPRATEEGL